MMHDASKIASERTTLALKPMGSPRLGQSMALQNEPWSNKNFMVEWDGSCWGEHFNINVQNWTEKN